VDQGGAGKPEKGGGRGMNFGHVEPVGLFGPVGFGVMSRCQVSGGGMWDGLSSRQGRGVGLLEEREE
jgi:hypothetical protein